MPLAFESISHGTVAFGFFNIDSDMLLLEHYFFFADDFCEQVGELAGWGGQGRFEKEWDVYHVAARSRIGDLMGAIHGIAYTGFIGEVYRRFPFPSEPEDFKQKAQGSMTQDVVEEIIARYGERVRIPLELDEKTQELSISEYRFSRRILQNLVLYVWEGGYPRWKDGIRPDYVLTLKERIERSRNTLFQNLVLEP